VCVSLKRGAGAGRRVGAALCEEPRPCSSLRRLRLLNSELLWLRGGWGGWVGRSSAITLAYLVSELRFSLREALTCLRERRPVPSLLAVVGLVALSLPWRFSLPWRPCLCMHQGW
jgi:hypothetical protein